MSGKVEHGIEKLDSILPLLSGIQSLDSEAAALYCRLLKSYVEKGRTLTKEEVNQYPGNAEKFLKEIVSRKLITIDGNGAVNGAYPFVSELREHRVTINNKNVSCMCALDALAVSPMFSLPTVIDSQCRITGNEIYLEQDGVSMQSGSLDAWFGIDWGAASSKTTCSASLCMEMIFLENEIVAKSWVTESLSTREIFDLSSAVEFAAGFFVPIAEYCQREI